MTAQPKDTLEQMLQHLGFDTTVEEHHLEEGLLLEVKSDDAGRLIGRQGQTLGDLQYILNRLLFHQDQEAPKVMVDVGGYRASAREALVKKAKDAAEKVRQIPAVTALQNAEPGNAQAADGLSEPMKVLGLERLLGDGIARVSVKPGRHGQQSGLRVLQVIESARQHVSIFLARRFWRDRIVKAIVAHVASPGAGIAGMLVNGKKSRAGPVHQDRLGAIAVVNVEIKHGDFLRS